MTNEEDHATIREKLDRLEKRSNYTIVLAIFIAIYPRLEGTGGLLVLGFILLGVCRDWWTLATLRRCPPFSLFDTYADYK
jgi:hypothetical protein